MSTVFNGIEHVRCDECAHYQKTREPFYPENFPRSLRDVVVADGECTAPIPECVKHVAGSVATAIGYMDLEKFRGVAGWRFCVCKSFKAKEQQG